MGNTRNRGLNPPIDSESLLGESTQENEMVKTGTLKPSIHIRKDSLRLLPTETGQHMIELIYDSYDEVTINFYHFAIESVKSQGNTDCYYIDLEKYPNPVDVNLPSGLNMKLPENLVTLNLLKYTLSELSFADNKVYPLIIEIVKFI